MGADDDSVERSLDGREKEFSDGSASRGSQFAQKTSLDWDLQEGCYVAGGLVGVSFSGDAAELNLFFPYTCISGACWWEEAESILLKNWRRVSWK